jgi:hypothetical protein
VIGVELGDIGPVDRAERPKRLPTVLSREEVQRLFAALSRGPNHLIAHLLYGSGLRPERSEEVVLGCECRRPFASGSKNSILMTAASTYETARAARTERPCFPTVSTAPSAVT